MTGSFARENAPSDYITAFELNEIEEYDEVWFLAHS